MLWRALSRMVAVRLALLVAIAAAGPAGVASSWHASNTLEHRLPVSSAATQLPSLEAGALPPIVTTHCEACQFGATLRAWTPTATAATVVPPSTSLTYGTPRDVALRELPAGVNAGRAPPRVS